MAQISSRLDASNRAKDQRIAEPGTAHTMVEKDHSRLQERLLEEKDA
jgi:hypothetical protein